MNKIVDKVLYLYIIGSLATTDIFALNLGFVHLGVCRLLLPILLFLCIGYALADDENRLGRLRFPVQQNSYALMFFVFWFFYALLSVLWAADNIAWLQGCVFLFTGVLTIIAFSLFTTSVKQVKTMLTLIVVFTMLHLFIGMNEMITGNYLYLEAKSLQGYQLMRIPVSCFTNVNDYAMVMLIGFFSSLGCLLASETRRGKFFSIIATIAFMLMVVATRSRANMFGMLLGCLSYFILYNDTRKPILKFVVAAVLLCVLAVSLIPALQNFYEMFTVNAFEVDTHSGGSDTIRLGLIRNGFIFLKQHLLLGTGIKNIEYHMESIGTVYGITNIHNWWMEILVSSGIFVFIGYLIFYGKLMLDMYRVSKRSGDKIERGIATAFFGFLVAFIIASISSSSNLGSYIVWTHFAIMIAFEGIAS